MTIYPLQSFGLGDILFCQKLVADWVSEGHNVIWGVEPQYVDIGKHFPNATYVDKNTLNINYDSKSVVYNRDSMVIPLRWSVELCNVAYKDCMKSKYMLLNKDWREWKNFEFVRDYKAEQQLMNHLGIENGEKYNIINPFFTGQNIEIYFPFGNVGNNYRNIIMQTIPGYTLIDWSSVLINAEEIHTVGTSINYLIEMLGEHFTNTPIHLYPRRPIEQDFRNYDYILSKNIPYQLHL